MTDSQFSSADPWGLPVDDGETDEELVSEPSEGAQPDPVQDAADEEERAGDLDQGEEIRPAEDLEEGTEQDESDHPDAQSAPDGPPPVDDVDQGDEPEDGDEASPDAPYSGEAESDDLEQAVAELELTTESEAGNDEPIDESADAVDNPEPTYEVPEDGLGSVDLDVLADELAEAIPEPVEDDPGSSQAADLEELSQKVSAWNEGGEISPNLEESEPAHDITDDTDALFPGNGLAHEATVDDREAGEMATDDPDADSDTLPPGFADPLIAEATDADPAAAATDAEDSEANPSGFTLSKMLAAAQSVFGDDGEDENRGPVEELPDELPSWAVHDTPMFAGSQDDGLSAQDDEPSEEADLAIVEAATEQLAETDTDLPFSADTADPFAAIPEDADGDELESLTEELVAELAERPDDGVDDSADRVDDGALDIGAPSEVESLEALADDLAAAATDEEESTTDEEESTTDGEESTTDEEESTTDGEESTTDEEESTTDGAGLKDGASRAALAPRGAMAAAAAFFRRSDDESTDEEVDEAETPEAAGDPSIGLETRVDDSAESGDESGAYATKDDTTATASPLDEPLTSDLATSAADPVDIADQAEETEQGGNDDDARPDVVIEDVPLDSETSDEDSAAPQASDTETDVADDEEVDIVDSPPGGIIAPSMEDDIDGGTDEDPWASIDQDHREPSGLDMAVGGRPVPSVYAELEELPPALPIDEANVDDDDDVDQPPTAPVIPDEPGGIGDEDIQPTPVPASDDWGTLWSESAQGWVEDAEGGSEWRTIVTTADALSTWAVDTYLGMVSGDRKLGDGPIEETLPAARTAALEKMVAAALTRAAHAVVAVSVSVATIGTATMVTASGTAATLRTED